jgi:hypothetical protein
VLTANAIAESLYSQVDEEGRSYSILSEIIDHRKDEMQYRVTMLRSGDQPSTTDNKRLATAG